MAGKQYKVMAIDEGYLVVDAPLSEFKEKGFFTMYDQTALPKGTRRSWLVMLDVAQRAQAQRRSGGRTVLGRLCAIRGGCGVLWSGAGELIRSCSAGYKTHAFHKFIEKKPFTQENFPKVLACFLPALTLELSRLSSAAASDLAMTPAPVPLFPRLRPPMPRHPRMMAPGVF